MSRLPDGYSLNGGLAFQGQPAHGNTAARAELEAGPTATQVAQATQQTRQNVVQNQMTQRAQMASALANGFKQSLQRATLAGSQDALPGMQAIAANPEILANIGLT